MKASYLLYALLAVCLVFGAAPKRVTAALSVGTNTPGNIFYVGQPVEFNVTPSSDTTATSWEIKDIDGKRIGAQQGSTTYIASTWYNWTTATGVVQYVNGSIMFNGASFQYSTTPSSTQLDVQEVAMREVGRMLGLIPNPTNQSSIMYGNIPFGETSRRTLTQDDQDAIAYLYPQSNPTGACATISAPLPAAMCPDNTGGSTGGSGGGGAGGSPGTGGAGGSGGTAGSGAGGAGGSTMGSSDSGCGCHVGGRPAAGVTALVLLGTLALCATRRRRSR